MIHFESNEQPTWTIVNDTVMGGQSNSHFEVDSESVGVFSGTVSLDNNGGFASVRNRVTIDPLKKNGKVALRVKGDGKAYQFRLKHKQNDYYSYIKSFRTTGQWETIEFDLSEMYPAFRGRSLNLPNFSHLQAQEVAFLIGNKKNEDFRLEIKHIKFE